MEKRVFLEKLENLLELPEGKIRGHELLAELSGWDSMAAIGFIAMADAEASITIVPAELANCKTVADLARLLSVKEA